MKYFICIILFLCIFKFNQIECVNKNALLSNQPNSYALWTNASNWSPVGVPESTDGVIIGVSGTNILLQDTEYVVVSNVTLSGLTKLDVEATLIADNIEVGTDAILTFSSLVPQGLYVDLFNTTNKYFDIYGKVNFEEGSTTTIAGSAQYFQNPGSLVENRGKIKINLEFVTNTLTTFNNLNNVEFNNVVYVSEQFNLFPNSSTTLNSFTFFVKFSILQATSAYVLDTSSGELHHNTTLLSQDSIFDFKTNGFNHSSPYTVYNLLKLYDSSAAVFINSTVNIDGTYVVLLQNSLLKLNQSTLNTTMTIYQFGESQQYLIDSELYMTSFLGLADNSTMFAKNSRITIIDNYLSLSNYSQINVFNTSFKILDSSNSTNDGILGLFDFAEYNFFEKSSFVLDGVFLVLNDSKLLITQESTFTVLNEIFFDDRTICKVSSNSNLTVLGHLLLEQDTYFKIYDSSLFVKENITMKNTSTFEFVNSAIEIDGKFIYYNEPAIYYSFMNNSEVSVKGFFINAGLLILEGSNLTVSQNFTTYGLLNTSDSNIIVQDGIFYISGVFDGGLSDIRVDNGILHVDDNSIFNCASCTIKIMNGSFKQGIGSTISITNTTFYNKNGKVETSGIVIVNNGGITNDGDFDVRSDILPEGNDTTNILNNGALNINGDRPSNVQTPLTNNGNINIEQNATFISFNQNDGKTHLNGGSMTSNQTININGGELGGSGLITGNVSNSGGVVGSKSSSHIVIDGDYHQDNNGQIVVTLDSSSLNITNSANLNGTIVIRVDETLINNNSTTNGSLINFASSTGDFKKVVIITYNKETGKETIQTNNCKVKTSHQPTSFSVLLTPNDQSEECQLSNSSENINSKSSKISSGAIIGIVVGAVGAVIISCTIYYFHRRKTHLEIIRKLGNITGGK